MNASANIIVLIALVTITVLSLAALTLLLRAQRRSIRQKRNGRPPTRPAQPLHLPTIHADRTQECQHITRRAAYLKWQQDHAALQAARAIQQAARWYGE